MASNLSAVQLTNDSVIDVIHDCIKQYNVDANLIEFEITETALIVEPEKTVKIIQAISDLGCKISLDDFGTGFSTFSYLKELPAHSVKIDGSFVKDMISSDIDRTLVTAIANVAMVLKKHSVAEFVETKEIFNHLDDIGVTYAQGYYISKPLPLSDALKFKFTP